MPEAPLLSICIISYNTADLTLDAVRSAAIDIENSPSLKNKAEIIVIDNNSKDDSVSNLKSFSRKTEVSITVIKNESNTGFAKANNQAIKMAKGEYILLLNSDTYVQPGCLNKLVSAFIKTPTESSADLSSYGDKLDRLGIVAASLVNPDGSYQPQGGSYPTLFSLAVHMFMLNKIPLIGRWLPATQRDVDVLPVLWQEKFQLVKQDWVAGTAMLLKSSMVEEIGDLDEAIFMYAEDVELCVRAKDHHWDVAILAGAFVTHVKTASSRPEKALLGELKGYQYIWAKHKPTLQLGLATLYMRLGAWLRILVFGTMGKSDKAQTYKAVAKAL